MRWKPLILFFSLILLHTPLRAEDRSSANPLCLAQHCGRTLLACGLDTECRHWLQCILQCGDDKIRCPSFCGFFFQGPRINQTSQCTLASGCVDAGFDRLPDYQHADRPIVSLQDLSGTYWFVASHGGPHIFDYDCQRFDFAPKDASSVLVSFSVPLMHQGRSRLTKAHGVFRTLDDGAIEVIYDNFVGYHERWYPLAKTDHTMLAHVCIGDGPHCYDYGTVWLARAGLEAISTEETQEIDHVLQTQYGLGLRDLKPTRADHCTNSPEL